MSIFSSFVQEAFEVVLKYLYRDVLDAFFFYSFFFFFPDFFLYAGGVWGGTEVLVRRCTGCPSRANRPSACVRS
jgi:hypothetical protein